ncbi:MAG: TadE/TadG family type IV pilus assembly protein [Candidatus Latescibacterota bacterium]
MSFARPTCRHPWRSQSGNAVVEFALVLPILFLLVFGITEFGRALMTSNVLYSAAREGARLAAIGSDAAAVTARVNEVLDAASVEDAGRSITVTGPGVGRTVTVAVQADFAVLTAQVLSLPSIIRLGASTAMRSEL